VSVRTRLLIAGWAVILPVLLAVLWLVEAEIEPKPALDQAEMVHASPVEDMVFTPGDRDVNIRMLGITDPRLVERVEKELRRLKENESDIVKALLANKPDAAGAFCPSDIPVVYRAALVLGKETDGVIGVWSAADEGILIRTWSAFDGDTVIQLFEAWERHPGRTGEDTAIALTALILGHAEIAAYQSAAPFRKFAADDGRLSAVLLQYPQARPMLARYVANTLFLAELVGARLEEIGCAGFGAE
jgi:hypothetical protein